MIAWTEVDTLINNHGSLENKELLELIKEYL